MAKKGFLVPGKVTTNTKMDQTIPNSERSPDRKNARPKDVAGLQKMPTLATKPGKTV